MRKKLFNRETLAEALQILQPVTPTNDKNQAHWYNEGFGRLVMIAQENYIRNFKHTVVDCKTKQEINVVISSFGTYPQWPPFIDQYASTQEALQTSSNAFWIEGFGRLIREEWNEMYNKFVAFLNSLQ